MKINQQINAAAAIGLSDLIVEEEMCINLRGRQMLCNDCAETCPSDALNTTLDAVELDREKCTGCNSCIASCLAGALRSAAFIPQRFIAALGDKPRADIHCRHSRQKGGGIVVPCLNVLDTQLFAAASGGSVRKVTLHGLDQCEQCEMGDAREHIEKTIRDIHDWLRPEALEIETESTSATIPGEREAQDQAHMDRRSFLRFGGANAVQSVVEWIVPGLMADEDDEAELLPFFQADEFPQRPSAYFATLTERRSAIPWAADAALPWMRRTVSDACSACLACGTRCPTGALSAREDAQSRVLYFDSSYCTNCRLCERICPEDAIVSRPVAALDEVQATALPLIRVAQRKCRNCGTAFIADGDGDEVCQVCRNEQELDDEWLDMLSG